VVGGDDPLAIGHHAGQQTRGRARCHDDLARLEELLSLFAGHCHPVGPRQPATSDDRGDAGALEQALGALVEALDDLGLVVHRRRQVETHLALDGDTEVGTVLGPLQELRRADERLGWDAAAVQAHTPHGIHLDAGRRQPVLRRIGCRLVATRPSTNDNEIEGVLTQGNSRPLL